MLWNHSNRSLAGSVPKAPTTHHSKNMFPAPETLSCLGYQALRMLGSHWLLSYRIRIIRVRLQRLDNLPPVPYIPLSLPPSLVEATEICSSICSLLFMN